MKSNRFSGFRNELPRAFRAHDSFGDAPERGGRHAFDALPDVFLRKREHDFLFLRFGFAASGKGIPSFDARAAGVSGHALARGDGPAAVRAGDVDAGAAFPARARDGRHFARLYLAEQGFDELEPDAHGVPSAPEPKGISIVGAERRG